MRYRPLYLIILFCIFAATLYAQKQPEKKAKPQNLIKNGNFENGEGKTPKHWSPFDGQTACWDKTNGNPGRCLLLDTTVLTVDKKLIDADIEAFEKKGAPKAVSMTRSVRIKAHGPMPLQSMSSQTIHGSSSRRMYGQTNQAPNSSCRSF